MALQVDIEKKLNDKTLKVSFDTEKAEKIVGILGASGCGKSMTLKCIAGLETPDKGRIVLNGRVLYDFEQKINVSVQKRRIGYLFQNYALFPNMTVQENVEAALKYRMDKKKLSKEERKRKAAYYLNMFHVAEIADAYPKRLSGGQQQRVALARIFASEPEVLMLDEPFSALDTFLKEKLQAELLDIFAGYEKDILMVTHSRDEIYRFCTSMLVIDNGKQVGFGRTEEIFKNPKTTAAAKLTGCKNIEAVRRINEHQMYVKNWDVMLEVKEKIPENTTHIGIRAHYLKIPENWQTKNVVKCNNGKILNDPFELVIVFEHDIWWKLSKEIWENNLGRKIPDALYIPEESIFYLQG